MVCFVDDDPVYWGVAANYIFRKGIKTGKCVKHDFESIDKMILEYCPSVAVVSIKSMQPETVNTVKWINDHYPDIKVIVSTQYSSLVTLKRCEGVKIIGYFFRTADDISKLLELINT